MARTGVAALTASVCQFRQRSPQAGRDDVNSNRGDNERHAADRDIDPDVSQETLNCRRCPQRQPIRKVATIEAAASNLESQPGLSLDRVMMMLTSAGSTRSENRKRRYRRSMDIHSSEVHFVG